MAGRARQSNVDRASSKATSTSWMCSGVWVAITDVRSRARPGGTAGAMAQLVYTPRSSRVRQSRAAAQSPPT